MAASVTVKGLRLSLGDAHLFEDAQFSLHQGERVTLIGANGAGKSTLMRLLAGSVEQDAGDVAFASGAVVGYAPQDSSFEGFADLRDFARAPSAGRSPAAAEKHRAEASLALFGLDPDRAPDGLSGGEARRATLARAFAHDPDILLLDEPTNHLDIAAIEALEQSLNNFRGACLIVSHDRRFLQRTSTGMLWLRRRQILRHEQGFSAFEAWAESTAIAEARDNARLETQLKAEEHWLRRGVTARRARNEGRRRKLDALRAERRTRLQTGARARFTTEGAGETSRIVIDAKGVSKRYGENELIAGLNLRIMRGDRLGIVGPNGAGKTTLLEVLLKQRAPDAGEVKHGESLAIAYVDQARRALDPEATLWDTLAPAGGDQVMVRGRPRHVASYAQEFLFSPAQLRQPTSALSGGERNRLALAVAIAQPANVLVLDEPTNDLDMDTLEALETLLEEYEGTVLVVSHDRAFLDGVATQIVGPVGKGRWAESPGGWSDFEREHGGFSRQPAAQREGAQAPRPARKSTKLSYRDERRAQELETLLAQIPAEIAGLERALSDASAFERDPAAFELNAASLAAARARLSAAESEWLEIELRREQFNAE